MAKYAINEIGMTSLWQLERDMRGFADSMEESRDQLLSVVYRNEEELGLYFVNIIDLLDKIGTLQDEGQEAMNDLADKAHQLAELIEELLSTGLKKH